jgi:hypothetical protein
MILLNNVVQDINHGVHQLTYTIGTGTAVLEQSVDDAAFQPVVDTDKSASVGVIATLCTSKVRAVLTGDAQLSINRVTP